MSLMNIIVLYCLGIILNILLMVDTSSYVLNKVESEKFFQTEQDRSIVPGLLPIFLSWLTTTNLVIMWLYRDDMAETIKKLIK